MVQADGGIAGDAVVGRVQGFEEQAGDAGVGGGPEGFDGAGLDARVGIVEQACREGGAVVAAGENLGRLGADEEAGAREQLTLEPGAAAFGAGGFKQGEEADEAVLIGGVGIEAEVEFAVELDFEHGAAGAGDGDGVGVAAGDGVEEELKEAVVTGEQCDEAPGAGGDRRIEDGADGGVEERFGAAGGQAEGDRRRVVLPEGCEQGADFVPQVLSGVAVGED